MKKTLIAFLTVFLFLAAATVTAEEKYTVYDGDSLQLAIDQANSNDKIKVGPGVYTENLIINKPVHLVGHYAIIDGQGQGNVIEITGDGVTLEGFTIRNSGKVGNDAGIAIHSSNNIINENIFEDVRFGIFLSEATNNSISHNNISSSTDHIVHRGNGIHLLHSSENTISHNELSFLQDAIYFDFSEKNIVEGNIIEYSRYGFHFMYSANSTLKNNVLRNNITGFMVMESNNILIKNNEVVDHIDFRGSAFLIYSTKDVHVKQNRILNSSVGIYLDSAKDSIITENTIAGNNVGIEFRGDNQDNLIYRNNFIGNVVQAKLRNKDREYRLDNGSVGNYWDDYRGIDTTGDLIGHTHYETGAMFDSLLDQRRELQLFFESPSVVMWSSAERLLPSLQQGRIYDQFPYVQPIEFDYYNANEEKSTERNLFQGAIGSLLFASSLLIFYRGRRS